MTKRQLSEDSEEFSLDVPNPDDEFSLDLPDPTPIVPPPANGPAPVNTRGEVVHHQQRTLSRSEQILPPTNPDRQVLFDEYGRKSTNRQYNPEPGLPFTSETVLTAILIWNALLEQGGFPVELLELIWNYTIQVFHFLENAVFVVATSHPISVTSLHDKEPRTHFFQSHPLTLWDARASSTQFKEKNRSGRYMCSPTSNIASFPVFMTMVYDNILEIDNQFNRNQEAWRKWHRATQQIVKNPKCFGGVIPKGAKITHYYVSSGELLITKETPGVHHYVSLFTSPQTHFNLRRTDGSLEAYQFSPYGPKRRLFLTVITESEEVMASRILPGFLSINSVPRMDNLRQLIPKNQPLALGACHENRVPTFFTFYHSM